MTNEINEMRTLVVQIAKALVDAPDEVTLEVVEKEAGSVLRLRVAPEDTGKVIGKQGRTARSIRTILAACGMKYRHHFSLEILEDHGVPASSTAAFVEANS
jgi:uncharacterized protein